MTDRNDLPPLTELPPGTFEVNRWLDVATGDLCEDAKARIRTEVEGHFAAAYEQLRSEGVDEDTAVTNAIERLGDATKANRRYKRLYLTESESLKIASLAKPSVGSVVGNWICSICFAISALVGLWFDGSLFEARHLWIVGFLLFLVAHQTVMRRFAKMPLRLVVSSYVSSVLLFAILSGWVFASGGFRVLATSWVFGLFAAALLIGSVLELGNGARLIAKLRKSSRSSNE